MSEIVKKVEELLKLPQELCKTCGKCCRLATFKGGLKYADVIELAGSQTEDTHQVEGAKDFLTIFEPYKTAEDARKIDADFVDTVLNQLGKNEGDMDFFYCKFIGNNNLCKIHEDRPMLCRMYPIPHERTLYFKDCGFRAKGIENWQKIVDIINELESKR
jgi:Fe-S-cluster containining protein